jgi:hypothetical protein
MTKFDKDKNNGLKARGMQGARFVTTVAVMAGLLVALKFALSFLPNVEVVTLLIAVFSVVWGVRYSFPATVVFCLVEMAIYGIAGWVLLYFIYWPTLALVFHFALRHKSRVVSLVLCVAIGAVFTVAFGVLSASVETLLVVGNVAKERLATFFVSYYVKGLWFDLVHVVSVVASILALFLPLVKIGERVKGSLEKAQQVEDDNPSR